MLAISSLLLCQVAACSVAPQTTSSPVRSSPDRTALITRIDSLVNAHLTSVPASSAAVGVVLGSDTIVMRGYGLADRAAGRVPTGSTIYQLASITKQMTAAAIMRLVDQGKLQLGDDISKYVSNFPLHGRHVTVRQLLNHTSGIPNYTSKPVWRTLWAADLTPDSLIGLVRRDSLDFEPGNRWNYSNTGYTLLGLIIERLSGKSYGDFLADEFFKPLGLTRTRYCPRLRDRDSSYAVGYTLKDSAFVTSEYMSMNHPWAAGAVCSTVRDYLVWQRALNTGRVVSPRSYAQMVTPDTTNSGLPMTYGLGLYVEQLGTHHMITHTGSINGFTTAQLYFPAESLSVIMLTNSDIRGPEPTTLNIARAMFGMPLVPRTTRPAVLPLAKAERDRVLGTYDLMLPSGRRLPLRVYMAGDTLKAEAEGLGPGTSALLHHGNDVFTYALDPRVRLTFTRAQGVITGVRLVHGDSSYGEEYYEGRRRQ